MNRNEYVRATLTEFVKTRSTPDTEMAEILHLARAHLEEFGLKPVVHEALAAIEASHGRGGVLFNGHLDTVPIGSGWTREQATVDGDLVYGRGTADMKAGCVAALAAARDLLDRGVPFSVLFTTDEETTMKGSIALAGSDLVRHAAAVIVGEPSSLRVIASEKGILWYRATVRGRSAHGSLPHLGDNAIYRMTRVLARLEAYARPTDPLAEITVNLGSIHGGSAPNVVADTCSVDLDVRYPPSSSKQEVETILFREFRKGASDAVIELFHEVPSALVSPDAPHVRLLRQLAAAEVVGVTYGTEMAWYAPHNPRCAVFGPGAPEMCHVPDEHVSVSEVARAAEIFAEFGARMSPGSQKL